MHFSAHCQTSEADLLQVFNIMHNVRDDESDDPVRDSKRYEDLCEKLELPAFLPFLPSEIEITS